MQIIDARTLEPAEIRRRPGGLLRVCVRTSPTGHFDGAGDLRGLLIADVLFRIAELDGVQVIIGHVETYPPEDAQALTRAAGLLGIRPPTVRTLDSAHCAPFGGPVDVHILAPAVSVRHPGHELLVEVAPTRLPGGLGAVTAGGHDPLAVRLALLDHGHTRPARLGPDELPRAQALLDRWRHRVAAWADSPSRPMHSDTVRCLDAAFHHDLDTPAVLAALRRLESEPGVPDGSRFETFAYADRVLALELPREIGRR
ncbi:hypothetical protein B7755_001730 [Streptomyces sp. NBS 14/10]|uniref:hypothetical protein n=1 Tax=Streptomyces sp. NBS 14/10 TaxID=1945643 RepID=UPI0015C5BF6D|nr:hypothetical protein [Streptomyces sp. NBS 14/10]KAK1186536.1 hypothetical protein B7755_001730 [Streptomyces sp. NBS 14/10]NUS87927.1 hypothetical protein [Streptomyces sp.]